MSLTARMDETRIDDRIEASARVGDVPSSPTRSPLHLASLSSSRLVHLMLTAAPILPPLDLVFRCVTRCGMSCFGSSRKSSLRICDQSCSALNRRLLWFSRRMLHFGSASKNLESASVRAPGSHTFTPASPSVSVHVSGSHTSTPASPANTPLDQPAEYLVSHLIDPVISLTQLGDFTADEAQRALFQSNNDLDAAAEILLSSCPPVPSARIRLEESQYRPPRGRGRGGHIPQLSRSSLSANPRFIANIRYL